MVWLLSLLLISLPVKGEGVQSPLPGGGGEAAGVGLLGFGDPGPELLEADQAFRLFVVETTGDSVVLGWQIAAGYYLYRERIRVETSDSDPVRLLGVELPPGEEKQDEFFGLMQVYYEAVEARVALQRQQPGDMEVQLRVGFQGCAEVGVCYPPMEKLVTVVLADSAAGAGTPGAFGGAGSDYPGQSLPQQDQIAGRLAGGGLWFASAAFFGFGLLLAFTPCVLPMIPILSSLVVGQGQHMTTRRAFALSLTYVLAMALTYTAAGVAAGLFGANLQVLFQAPWILISFAGLFVLLALAMFGFYNLEMPHPIQEKLLAVSNRQRSGSYLGVGVMGLLSALIVGPCVAAPLAGALMYIGQTGDALLGGLALFSLSLGMGVPLLVLGTTAGRWLPRTGPWMETVKRFFGFVLLGVAIFMLERLVAPWVALLMWACLAIFAAIYLGALDPLQAGSPGWRRFAKGGGLILLVYGIVLMIGGASGGHDVFRPLKDFGASVGAAERSPRVAFRSVKGPDGLQRELQRARTLGQPVMLDFYADWCVSCKELENYTFTDPRVQSLLAGAILLRTDVTANDQADRELLRRFGLFGPPALLFFGPDGEERSGFRLVGFVAADQFLVHARQALS